MSALGLLQRQEHPEPRVLRRRGTPGVPVTAHVRAQVRHNVSQEHNMASSILMPRGQRPERNKANPVAVPRLGAAVTE